MLYSRHGHVVLGLDLKVHIFFQCQSTGFNSHIIVSECSGQDTAGVFKRKLGESDSEVEIVPHDSDLPVHRHTSDSPSQWSSGICACCDDMQSCMPLSALLYRFLLPLLSVCEECRILGSGTLAGSCMTHLIFWALVNTVCCLLSDGTLLGLPGCFVACYACEAPCGDFTTHFFCHLCAICQEYREIRERSGPETPDLRLSVVTAPPVQTMETASKE
ncbi:hypothetical protein AAG906_037121 [Vitis piasezkii]